MFRLVSLNLNGIRSAAAKGFEAWAEGVGADCMGVQEVKAQADTVDGRFDTRRRHDRAISTSPRRRATRASACTAGSAPSAVRVRLRRRRVRRRGPLRRGALRPTRAAPLAEAQRRQLLLPERLVAASTARPPSSASSTLMAPHLQRTEGRARGHPGRRHQHRAQGDRPEELEGQPQEQRLPARGARLDDAACSRSSASSTCSARSTRIPSNTPGGATAARRCAKNVGWRLDYHLATPGIARSRAGAHLPRAALLRPRAAVIDYDFSL